MNYLHGTCALCLLLIAYFTHITMKLTMNQIVFQFGKKNGCLFWLVVCFQFQRSSFVVGCVLLCTGLLNSNANRLRKNRMRIKRHTKHHTYTREQKHIFFFRGLVNYNYRGTITTTPTPPLPPPPPSPTTTIQIAIKDINKYSP